ncbi:MAG: cyclic pyranopterin monophosphate synthase MoaC [bacterium]
MTVNDDRKLTHFNEQGEVHMVDVGDKVVSKRKAIAEGWIRMRPETLEMIRQGDHKKGDVLSVARVAGIMAAKKTSELIPLCHPLMLTRITIDMEFDADSHSVRCEVCAETAERTGVEMEALTGLQVALLTIYDMCKAVDRGMEIRDIRLVHKSGGNSGDWNRAA